MYKVQYRRVSSIDEDSLNRMSNAMSESVKSSLWNNWRIGGSQLKKEMVDYIESTYGPIVEKFHLGYYLHYFRYNNNEGSNEAYIQIRFLKKESPWHIGLNDV